MANNMAYREKPKDTDLDETLNEVLFEPTKSSSPTQSTSSNFLRPSALLLNTSLIFCIVSLLVIFLVIQFSIYSVLWIKSNDSAQNVLHNLLHILHGFVQENYV